MNENKVTNIINNTYLSGSVMINYLLKLTNCISNNLITNNKVLSKPEQ